MSFLKCTIHGVKHGETTMEEPPMEQEVTTGKISRGPSPAPDTEAAMLGPEEKKVREFFLEPFGVSTYTYKGVIESPCVYLYSKLVQEFIKELFKWNPHADLTDFNFVDDKFVEMCRNRDPVSSYSQFVSSVSMYIVPVH